MFDDRIEIRNELKEMSTHNDGFRIREGALTMGLYSYSDTRMFTDPVELKGHVGTPRNELPNFYNELFRRITSNLIAQYLLKLPINDDSLL